MPGRTGRRPKPAALRLLQGERRPSRTRAEPRPEAGRPPTPAHLKGAAAAEWSRLAELTETMRVLTVADGPILEATCAAYGEMRAAQRLLAREGAVYNLKSKAGGMMRRKHPAADIAADAWRRYVQGLGHFGLSPSTRSKVSALEPKEIDPFEVWSNPRPAPGKR
jgi:P27 family predicted phage terminase small subunit